MKNNSSSMVWPVVCGTSGKSFDAWSTASRIHHYESDAVVAASIVQGGEEQYVRVCLMSARDNPEKERREARARFEGFRARVASDPELARASGMSSSRTQEIARLAEASRAKRSAWGNRPKGSKKVHAKGPEVINLK